MPRPDEGLIHSWLDGQLPPEEASRIEQLAATDPEWAEAVAEARGLVAASSRILSALDHVPSGVIPKGETVRASRRLPWWTKAAAAVVIMVGGTVLLMQRASTPMLSEAGEKKVVASAVDASLPPVTPPAALGATPAAAQAAPATTVGAATTAATRAPMPSSTPAPAAGGMQNVQARMRADIVESKPEKENANIQMMRTAPQTVPSAPPMARDAASSMPSVGTPNRAAVPPSTSAAFESRGAADRTLAAKTVLDARQKDTVAERSAAKLVIPTLKPAEPTARRVGEVMGGVISPSRAICYEMRDAKSPSDAGVIMRTVRMDGDTLRLEPAHGTSTLRAWIVWRDGVGHGAMTRTAESQGAVAVVATRFPCPAP